MLIKSGAVSPSAVQLLTSGVISSPQATLDIVLTSYTGYRLFKLMLANFIPASSDATLAMRVSTNGGSSYDSSGYSYVVQGFYTSNTAANAGSSSGAYMLLAGYLAVGFGGSSVGASGEITLFGPAAAAWPKITALMSWVDPSSRLHNASVSGCRNTAQDTDAIQLLFSTGNISSGDWALYGYS